MFLKVQESFVPLGGGSGELGLAVGGGADYGSSLCKDLRLYLSKCFTPGSMDSQLQQLIRENLYLRAVPCTTRQPREGEITGVDYNFVSIEEFFSLEESGALLESGKFKGNYYGTPRPVHIGPESPPITYQEHRNLLRNFRTRSKSLSNLEKAVEEGDNSEEDSGLSAGSAGAPPTTLALSQSWESTVGSREGMENGGGRGRPGGPQPEKWELAFSDSGESYYIDHISKTTSWLEHQNQNKDLTSCTEQFTEEPSQLRGYSIHTRLSKGPRGFGFNIVGGSRPREFLQVYSVTPGGPPALSTADILVYINDTCVLGRSHKEVVEMLKSVPMGQSVDVVLRRGYPMLYNPDGCPKQNLETVQPVLFQSVPPASPPTPPNMNGGLTQLTYSRTLDGNGSTPGLGQALPSFAAQTITNGLSGLPPLSSTDAPVGPNLLPERPAANHTDSDGGTSSGTQRSSLIHYKSSTLPALSSSSSLLHHQNSKSSESDLSTATLPIASSSSHTLSKLPLSQPETGLLQNSTPPSGLPFQRPPMPQTSLALTPPRDIPPCGFNGCPASHQVPSPASKGSSGLVLPLGPGSPGSVSGGELVPVALGRSEVGGLGFSITAGGPGGQLAVVRRVWDRRQCPSLQPGDVIVKINGADVQNLSFSQSTSFLDSVPVTLTLEPRDLLGVEESAGGPPPPRGTGLGAVAKEGKAAKMVEVELRRRPGEGFGFVIASQEALRKGALPPTSFSYREAQDDDTITTTATSLRPQRGGGAEERKWRREGETKRKTAGPPDLDLDMVEKEAHDEERQKEERGGRRRQEEEEERKMRSQTDRQRMKSNQGSRGG
ncbi:unnamed protein product [Lampetra planeri]